MKFSFQQEVVGWTKGFQHFKIYFIKFSTNLEPFRIENALKINCVTCSNHFYFIQVNLSQIARFKLTTSTPDTIKTTTLKPTICFKLMAQSFQWSQSSRTFLIFDYFSRFGTSFKMGWVTAFVHLSSTKI